VSTHRERPPLRITPRCSRLLAAFLLATHGAALAVVFVIPLDWCWRAGLAALVLFYLAYALATRVLFMAPWALREATWMSDGSWSLTLVSGEEIDARLLPSTFAARQLLVLNFRCRRWRSPSLVLLPDSLDALLLRRLRVRLRLRGAADSTSPDALA